MINKNMRKCQTGCDLHIYLNCKHNRLSNKWDSDLDLEIFTIMIDRSIMNDRSADGELQLVKFTTGKMHFFLNFLKRKKANKKIERFYFFIFKTYFFSKKTQHPLVYVEFCALRY